MAGLAPAIHVFLVIEQASEATPFFERACAGMTVQLDFIPL